MKILIASNHFDYLSGAPLYVYELSRVLAKRGHQVTVASNKVGDPLMSRAMDNGVEVVPMLAMLAGRQFDILHLNQPETADEVLARIPDVPALQTCHSEWQYEIPYIHPRIKKYVCIRPSILEKLKTGYGIDESMLEVVYNGIDFTRFNTDGNDSAGFALWVGTIDELRKKSALDFYEEAKDHGRDVVFIGKKFSGWLDGLEAAWLPEVWGVEKYVKSCVYTGGILLGRTTLESWACGKPSIIYDIDLAGNILSQSRHEPPEDMSQYDIETMTTHLERIYASVVDVQG